MPSHQIKWRRRRPSLNRRVRAAVVKDFPPDLRAVANALPDEAEVWMWSNTFPTGKENLSSVGSIDRMVVNRLAKHGIRIELIDVFLNALVEAVTNAIQHGRARTNSVLQLEIHHWSNWSLVKATVTNQLPPLRRVPLPEPKHRKLWRRGRGTWMMACEFVNRYEVEVKNGDFYRVILTQVVARP